MTRLVLCTALLSASLALALWTGCAQRDTGPEASRTASPEAPAPEAPEAALEPKPETAAPQAPPSHHTVDLGYFNEMIEQFAAAETLVLRMEAQPQGFDLVRKEYQLKRPDRFRALHAFNGRGGERICDGKTVWMVSRARKEYFEMSVVAGRAPKLGLLPELFQSAREIARGEDKYAGTLARGHRVETETINNEPCDVVEIKLDQPQGTRALLWLTQARRLPLRVRMISVNGVIDYEVRTLEIGAELDNATFTFTPGPDWSPLAIPAPPTPQPPRPGRSENERTESGSSEMRSETSEDD